MVTMETVRKKTPQTCCGFCMDLHTGAQLYLPEHAPNTCTTHTHTHSKQTGKNEKVYILLSGTHCVYLADTFPFKILKLRANESKCSINSVMVRK